MSYDGLYFTLDTARVYSLPEIRPRIYLAAPDRKRRGWQGARATA